MSTHTPRGKKAGRLVALFALVLVALPGLARAGGPSTRTVVDETGRTLRVPERIERIVSLAPNLTEMVYALGLEERLVGVSNQCDFPPAARSKPRVGDVINPSLERIIELKPDVVLGTTAGNRREIVAALDHAGIPLYGVDPHSVGDIFASIGNLADLLGVPEAGRDLSTHLRARLAALAAPLAGVRRPRVLFVLWLEPLLTAGSNTFVNDVLRRAGADSITAGLREDWPRLSLEVAIERDPDYLVLPRTHSLEARLTELASRPPWQRLRAVEEKRILWLDDAILRPGPRIVDAIESLARELHPEAFPRVEAARQ